jgi:hypothetical protein
MIFHNCVPESSDIADGSFCCQVPIVGVQNHPLALIVKLKASLRRRKRGCSFALT